MRKIKEILRLRYETKLSIRQIAESTSVGRSTVSDLLGRAEAAGIGWPLDSGIDEAELERRLYPGNLSKEVRRPEPDWELIHREMKRKGVTLQLLWVEYKEQNPDGYQYSQFCSLYRSWRDKVDVVLRIPHRAGEKLFVDYAGLTVPVVEPETGDVFQAHIFVAVLGASNFMYFEAHPSQALPHWIGGHVRAFEYFGGTPELVIPDNLKAAVQRACRYEPDLNPSYQEMAVHYGVAIVPARVGRPRDKAKAEVGVQIVEQQVLAPMRHRTFFGIGELNDALKPSREALNDRPFQKLPGNRRTLFETVERPALRPLPPTPYEYAEWRKAGVNIDCHIDVDKVYYSVPKALVGKEVQVRLSAAVLEVFFKGNRVASHVRKSRQGTYVTNPAHLPAAHRQYLEWTPSRLIQWATRQVGPQTGHLIEEILKSKPHPEQGYRRCLGIIRLEKVYGADRVEAAAKRALSLKASTYRSLKSILETGMDKLAPHSTNANDTVIHHENVRGAEYYRGGV